MGETTPGHTGGGTVGGLVWCGAFSGTSEIINAGRRPVIHCARPAREGKWAAVVVSEREYESLLITTTCRGGGGTIVTTGLENMALMSTFVIKINGNRRTGKKFETLTKWIVAAIRRLDPKVRIGERHFKDIGYRLDAYGEPVFFEEIDNVQSKIRKYVSAFLREWNYEIIVRLREKR